MKVFSFVTHVNIECDRQSADMITYSFLVDYNSLFMSRRGCLPVIVVEQTGADPV